MHFTFGITGKKTDVDETIKWLETRTFMMPFTDKKGKKFVQPISAVVRPIQFYDYIFPREYLHQVLNSLNMNKGNTNQIPTHNAKGKFKTHLAMLRKILKLKKIPEPDKSKGTFHFPMNLATRIVGIGIRDDKDLTFDDGKTHEGL